MCEVKSDPNGVDDDSVIVDIPTSDDFVAPRQHHHKLPEVEGVFDSLFKGTSQLRFGGKRDKTDEEEDDDDIVEEQGTNSVQGMIGGAKINFPVADIIEGRDELAGSDLVVGEVEAGLQLANLDISITVQGTNSVQEAVSEMTVGGEIKVSAVMEGRDLKKLRELGGAEAVASILGSDLVVGKVAPYPPLVNLDTTITVHQIPNFFLKACRNEAKMLLLLQSVVTAVCGIVRDGPRTGWWIGAVIFVFWLLRVVHPSVSSFWAARKMERRLKEANGLEVEVIRSGQSQVIGLCDLVVGDIVSLTEGSKIPADGLFVGCDGIALDGALDNQISTDHNPFLYYGSKVAQGPGNMLVTAIGPTTVLGKLMSSVDNIQNKDLMSRAWLGKPNPCANISSLSKEVLMEDRIEKPLAWLGNFAILMSIFVVLVEVLLKNSKTNVAQTLKGAAGADGMINLFNQTLNKVGKLNLLAALIPTLVFGLQHGMKIVVAVCLKYWNLEMESSEVSSKSLSAYGTMGIVTVICIDTSGGLMCEKVEVSSVWIGQEAIDDNNHFEMSPAVLEALSCGVGGSALAEPKVPHNPTDEFLISWAKSKWGMNMEFLKEGFTVVDHGKLSSTKEGSGVLLRNNGSDENTRHLHWKGDAKPILDMCSHYYDCRGEIHGIEDQKSEFESVIKQMEDGGLRPIAFAYKKTDVPQLEEEGLILVALVAMKYQVLEELKSMVMAFKRAGISFKLVSEDELSISRAMACELGLLSPGSNDEILAGQEFRNVTPDSKTEKVDQITVMGSSLPTEKFDMVKFLKQKGHVVGFLGGWIGRDAPILKEADMGITVGTWSSEKAKENSDIVLASGKSFSSLISVLESARHYYNKIQNFNQVQFISNVSALLITNIETIYGEEPSITILHFLYLNLVLAVLGGVKQVMKLPHKEVKSNHPGKRDASIITKVRWIIIVLQLLYQVIFLLGFQFKGEALPIPGINSMNQEVSKAMIFNGFILCQIFNFLLLSKAGNYRFLLVLVLFTVVHVAGFTGLCMKLKWVQWVFCFLFALLSWGINSAMSILIKWKSCSTD